MKTVSIFLLVAISLATVFPGAGRVYAGGEEETVELVEEQTEEKVVIATDKADVKAVWFVIGFVVAILITAL